MPAMAGHTMRPTLNTMALMPSALVTSARSSTIKRIKVCRTGISKALAMPISEAMARYAATFVTPAVHVSPDGTHHFTGVLMISVRQAVSVWSDWPRRRAIDRQQLTWHEGAARARSSVVRAFASHARGRRFNPCRAHHCLATHTPFLAWCPHHCFAWAAPGRISAAFSPTLRSRLLPQAASRAVEVSSMLTGSWPAPPT